MNDDLDLAAIEARAATAYSGPWKQGEPVGMPPHGHMVYDSQGYTVGIVRSSVSAEFIAHARTDIDALTREVRRLRERLVSPFTVQPEQVDHTKRCYYCWSPLGERHGLCCEVAGNELPPEERYKVTGAPATSDPPA